MFESISEFENKNEFIEETVERCSTGKTPEGDTKQ